MGLLYKTENALLKGQDFTKTERRRARRITRLGLHELLDHCDDREAFHDAVIVKYRQQYGNPVIFLWIIGIVINLIWQWWLQRKDKDELKSLRSEITDEGFLP